MYNYLKCKFPLNLSDAEKNAINRDWEKIVFLTEPIDKKVGEFLIRKNGELCHNFTEYEKVDEDKIGEPGVIWNGTTYARIKNTRWDRVEFTGKISVKTEVISKQVDAGITIEFEFNNGYVVNHKPEIVLIDNSERLAHDQKIKQLAIKRANMYNSLYYRIYTNIIKSPMIKILRCIRTSLDLIQDLMWKLEQKINKL